MPGLGAGQLYHFQADGPFDPEQGQRFNGRARLIDPYAKALAGHFLSSDDGIVRPPKCVVIDDTFDWENDRHLKRPLADTIIYEMHVRGFTRDATSGAGHPGTYLGVIEKIPYLKSLGVTAVELMPVLEFPMESPWGHKLERPNYWGYDPLAFFAPHQGYAAGSEPGCQVYEFKQMVKALHEADIEVILDVVFNHTAEGNELGPTLSFKGLENRVYYMLGNGGSFYRNFTGCGNTINGNHPIVREMLFLCLRNWVQTYHVDGFRFDLASILSRDRSGEIIPNPPVVEMIAEDPLLSDTKVIAEAWDAAGAYQVGSFANLRWAEWNGRYRDEVRQYWRGDMQMVGDLATRLAGSADLYQAGGRHPYHSINFVTSHDGFTLNDLVSYAHKHNEDNGEGNRDGDDNNFSANYGVEGPTRKPSIELVRQRQIKNFLATLLLSQGVPMLLAGDECRRTQRGNNNAYCQDNQISWFDWSLVDQNAELLRFVRGLIALRRANPTLRRRNFLSGIPGRPGELPDVCWFNRLGRDVDWRGLTDQSLVCVFGAPTQSIRRSAIGGMRMFELPADHTAEFAAARDADAESKRRAARFCGAGVGAGHQMAAIHQYGRRVAGGYFPEFRRPSAPRARPDSGGGTVAGLLRRRSVGLWRAVAPCFLSRYGHSLSAIAAGVCNIGLQLPAYLLGGIEHVAWPRTKKLASTGDRSCSAVSQKSVWLRWFRCSPAINFAEAKGFGGGSGGGKSFAQKFFSKQQQSHEDHEPQEQSAQADCFEARQQAVEDVFDGLQKGQVPRQVLLPSLPPLLRLRLLRLGLLRYLRPASDRRANARQRQPRRRHRPDVPSDVPQQQLRVDQPSLQPVADGDCRSDDWRRDSGCGASSRDRRLPNGGGRYSDADRGHASGLDDAASDGRQPS